MAIAPSPRVTPEDLLQMPDGGMGFELVNGELKELNVSNSSSRTAGRICTRLDNFCEETQAGWVFPEGESYQCFSDDPDRVRRADTSFIAVNRMSVAQYREHGHCPIVPDLVAEVISPNDNAEEVEEKIAEWLAAGVKLLWEVYPETERIRTHRPDGTVKLLRAGDVLTAQDVLPGFACPVAELFRLPSSRKEINDT